jgi:NADH-quinone oxidoreductase subunit J
MLETLFFFIVAAVAVLASILVVTCRNPINSAMALIMTFFCLATLYVMLDAPFIAAIQVIVYAGAIMVLIIFVIMLLNLRTDAGMRYTHAIVAGGVIGFLTLFETAYFLLRSNKVAPVGNITHEMVIKEGHTELIAKAMFTEFLLPFEITSILLLVAIVGAVVLTKRKI